MKKEETKGKNQPVELEVHFEPGPKFEEEFVDFVRWVLGWEEQDEKLYQNTKRNTGGTCQNEVK